MKIKPDKTVKALVHRAFPSYKGRKYSLEVSRTIYISNTHWDGGSKNEYVAVPLVAGFSKAQSGAVGKWYEGGVQAEVEVPEGIAVVEHTIYCGQDMGLTIHLNPADASALLPEKAL